jgi:transcriptional antiterminator RfaH
MELETSAWFCVRSRQKQEHIAAANLRRLGIEALNPRLRLRRATRRGPVWFTEALFPSYLFARFDLIEQGALLKSAGGVAALVQFGNRPPSVPDEVIAELRAMVGEEETITQDQTVDAGARVVVAAGPFQGLLGMVRQVLPAAERVRVLLEILGRTTEVELDAPALALADARAWKESVAGKRA